MEVSTEKRRFRRLEEEFDVDCEDTKAVTRNISASGVCIYSERTYPRGSILPLIISLPSEGGLIKAKAKVIWSDKIEGRDRIGMEYIEIEGADVAIIYAQAAMKKRREEMQPQKPQKRAEGAEERKPKEKTKPELSTKDINIMVIDDEQVILDLFTRVLGAKGYNVICAKDGFEALEAAKDKRIDLVFIDIKLPGGMNGVGTFRMLKKEKPGIKAVMITGFSVEKEIAEAIKNGAVGALKKPFDNIQEIYDVIEKNVREVKEEAKDG